MNIPAKTTVLVVGGGPAGSTAASFLARAGVDVVLVERDEFPRYHIGESLLPSCLEILELIGARQTIENHGFQRKPGAFLDWKGEQWALNFGELGGNYHHAFQVPRDEFDHLLLLHAAKQGVRVFERTPVRELIFEGARPVGAICGLPDAAAQEIRFDYLIDASGRAGIIANRYLQNRKFHHVFKNVAVWGYWEDVRRLPGDRAGAIAVGSVPDGWIWAIPFSDGKMSIGLVVHNEAFRHQRGEKSISQIYLDAIAGCPLMAGMTADGRLVSDLKTEQDYSYASQSFVGPGYFLIGDAACFLDPLLSTGVHLAMYSAMLASASIASTLRSEVTEAEALDFYEQSYRGAYLRFLVFVAAFYDMQGKERYFSKAEQLSHYDADPLNIRRAFLNLVSGLEDMADVEHTTTHLMGEMSRRIQQNLELRRDKEALGRAEVREQVSENERFFDGIEGLTALSPDNAIGGLYVRARPKLGLARLAAAAPPVAEELARQAPLG